MTTATANKVKAPKKGFKLDRQMIPTLAAVVIFILMIIMGQALFGTYIRLGFISSLFIDHAYLIILAVAMTLPILTGGIDLSVGAIVAITAVVGLKRRCVRPAGRHLDRGIQHAAVHRDPVDDVPGPWSCLHHLHRLADLPAGQ